MNEKHTNEHDRHVHDTHTHNTCIHETQEHSHGHDHHDHTPQSEHTHECNHDHSHDHAHSHNHTHHDNCDCPDCASDAATAVVEQALRFGKAAPLTLERTQRVAVLEQRITQALNHIAELIAVEGVIPGHLKALLQYGSNSIAFSSTIAGEVSVLRSAGVTKQDVTDTCTFTLNVISALPSEADLDTLWDNLLDELTRLT